jgi:hypothetical protein
MSGNWADAEVDGGREKRVLVKGMDPCRRPGVAGPSSLGGWLVALPSSRRKRDSGGGDLA